MRIFRRAVGTFSAVLIICSGAASAEGSDAPPTATLSAGEAAQTGRLGSHCWGASRDEFRCVELWLAFPRSQQVQTRDLSVVLEKAQPPREFGVVYWRKSPGRKKTSPPRGIDATLAPTPGHQGWVITFKLPPLTDVRLAVYGSWIDEDMPMREESAAWTFRLTRDE